MKTHRWKYVILDVSGRRKFSISSKKLLPAGVEWLEPGKQPKPLFFFAEAFLKMTTLLNQFSNYFFVTYCSWRKLEMVSCNKTWPKFTPQTCSQKTWSRATKKNANRVTIFDSLNMYFFGFECGTKIVFGDNKQCTMAGHGKTRKTIQDEGRFHACCGKLPNAASSL